MREARRGKGGTRDGPAVAHPCKGTYRSANLEQIGTGCQARPHQAGLAGFGGVFVRPSVANTAQSDQVGQPVRVRPAPAGDVVNLGHRTGLAMLTDARVPFPHLLPPLRVDRVPPPSPIGYGSHDSSRCTA